MFNNAGDTGKLVPISLLSAHLLLLVVASGETPGMRLLFTANKPKFSEKLK